MTFLSGTAAHYLGIDATTIAEGGHRIWWEESMSNQIPTLG